MSEPKGVTCGVPQGSILGPLLFLLYVNDMASAVRCKLLLYADDSALIASGKIVADIESTLRQGTSPRAFFVKSLHFYNFLSIF